MKTTWEKIGEYTRSIRNQEKKYYAIGYAEFRTGYRINEPESDLSFMAKQAVRMNIENILKDSIMAMPITEE